MRLQLIAFSLTATLAAQEFDTRANYTKREVMIPMRDGVKLFTQIYEPNDRSRQYPIMLFRTPYGIRFYGEKLNRLTLGPSPLFTRSGYIFAYQDVRGKFRSEGDFEVMRPVYHKLDGADRVDESTDNYDTIQWLLNDLDNDNGKVGQWGISYPGFQTIMGMIDAHPALVAASPQASPSDMFIGDDFHHNGAFRLMYTFSWLAGNAAVRTGQSTNRQSARFSYGTPDGYDFFMRLGALPNVDRLYFKKQVPTWNEYMEHGTYDDYWKRQNVLQHMKDITPAVLNVAGWFDAEDFYGPMSIYYEIEKNDRDNKSILVVGPWRHGGWAREGATPSATSTSARRPRATTSAASSFRLRALPEGHGQAVVAGGDRVRDGCQRVAPVRSVAARGRRAHPVVSARRPGTQLRIAGGRRRRRVRQ